MRALWLALVAAGCGRIGFDPGVDLGDGGGSGGGDTGDTGVDAPPPCATGPWGNIRRQTALATTLEDWEPALHPGGLVLVYARKVSGSLSDLYVATRADQSSDFSNPQLITSLNAAFEFGPAWSANGTQLYFSRDDTMPQLFVSSYAGGVFAPDASVASPSGSLSVDFSDDGLELFYTTVKPTFDYDIHHASRPNTTAAWIPDPSLDGFNRTMLSEGWPTFDELRQAAYFEHDNGPVADLVMTIRTGTTWGALITVTDLGEGGDPEISRDGLTMLFSSRRFSGGTQLNDIYMATRSCL